MIDAELLMALWLKVVPALEHPDVINIVSKGKITHNCYFEVRWMNVFTKNWKAVKDIVLYKPPQNPKPFVLEESEHPTKTAYKDQLSIASKEQEALIRYANRMAIILAKTRECMSDPEQGTSWKH